ncbi:MAG: hypothetical protein OHK0039_39370 [Bacteroidia bacterium]
MLAFGTRSLTRILIYGLAVCIIGGSLLYSNYLARQLRDKEREEVENFAAAMRFIADPSLSGDDPETAADAYAYAFTFISGIAHNSGNDIPKILLGENNSIDGYTLEMPDGMEAAAQDAYIRKKAAQLSSQYDPIRVEFDQGRFQTIVYGESSLLKQLRWFPLAQLFVAFTFIGVVFYGFAVAKRNEQNRVWVGLAKETAHQLGTPVSSLMAWIELLRIKLEDQPEDSELITEMEHDVRRLEIIAERFSKIGSQPELESVPFGEVLERSADYLRKRMTQHGRIRLYVESHVPAGSTFRVNPQLFDWVIENLLKNALDAIQSKEGSIRIEAGERPSYFYIDITDTGKGIPKGDFKKVFEPGFTTKKRGWGLGLSLSKRIVENYHKGRIFVRHSELGKGTTFRVQLPR